VGSTQPLCVEAWWQVTFLRGLPELECRHPKGPLPATSDRLPFGLTSESSTFRRFVGGMLMGYLGDFCGACFYNVLDCSDDLEDHRQHERKVLQRV
jgi:hypothetical protein